MFCQFFYCQINKPYLSNLLFTLIIPMPINFGVDRLKAYFNHLEDSLEKGYSPNSHLNYDFPCFFDNLQWFLTQLAKLSRFPGYFANAVFSYFNI